MAHSCRSLLRLGWASGIVIASASESDDAMPCLLEICAFHTPSESPIPSAPMVATNWVVVWRMLLAERRPGSPSEDAARAREHRRPILCFADSSPDTDPSRSPEPGFPTQLIRRTATKDAMLLRAGSENITGGGGLPAPAFVWSRHQFPGTGCARTIPSRVGCQTWRSPYANLRGISGPPQCQTISLRPGIDPDEHTDQYPHTVATRAQHTVARWPSL